MSHPFSETYISMARAAEEIQAMRAESEAMPADEQEYQLGDWFHGDHGPELFDRSTGYMGEHPVWLPLLHQLLGMLGNPDVFMDLAEDFNHDWVTHFEEARKDWHELALSLVMREKYGKRWDGKAWVKS